MSDRLHMLKCIAEAKAAGFVNYADSLCALYQRQFGFSTVTGADFRRSMDWAAAQPPGPLSSAALRGHVAEHRARQSTSPCTP